MYRMLLSASLPLFLTPLAVAQEQSQKSEVTRTYLPSEFARYAPRTAFDMVDQIPGFSFNSDNDGSRGFGQASGNVLLNGKRVSGKSNGVRDALSRIPAENVARIDIVDGATLDIPGLSGQVANVIAEADENISGSWSWEGRVRETVRPYFDKVELSASGKSGEIEWTLGVETGPERGGAEGTENVFDADGTLLEERTEKFNFIGTGASASGSLAWSGSGGDTANLNASYAIWQPNVKEVSLRQRTDGSPQINRLFQRAEDEWNTEIGGDYETGFASGRLKLIGLYRYEYSPFKNRVFASAVDASSAEETIFNQTIDEAESILRAEYSWARDNKHDWQISLEGAFNMLESDADAFESRDFAPLGLDLITGPASRVEEIRGEIAATHGQKLSDKLTIQASLAAEFSEISQSGGTTTKQTFTRPKGFVSASYVVRDGYTLTGRIERKVGQLNFFDFIASSNINEGTERGANPNLSPQQSWALELEAERDFGNWGAGSIKFIAEDIEDLVDRIPLPGGGDGVGNIESAELYVLEFSGTWKLDPAGLDGVQISTNGNFAESSVTDPLTGETRRLNDGHVRSWDVELRHDIPNTDWAWGVYSEDHFDGANYFLNEIAKRKEHPAFTQLFIEHKDIYGMTGVLTFGNILGRGDTTRRLLFAPDRNGILSSQEIREREFGDIVTFSLSGSF